MRKNWNLFVSRDTKRGSENVTKMLRIGCSGRRALVKVKDRRRVRKIQGSAGQKTGSRCLFICVSVHTDLIDRQTSVCFLPEEEK